MTARASNATVQLGSRTVQYTVRRSARARRMSLRLIPGHGLEVVLPRGFTLRDAAAFVRNEHEWVLSTLDRYAVEQSALLQNGSPLPYLDEQLSLRLTPGDQVKVTRNLGVVTVTTTEPAFVQAALDAWYRAEARRVLRARATQHAATLDVELRRIAIKDTRSRWGSCSSLGNLNFSWRIMLAPEAVMDYVVAHEVAHLRELNHSPRFWQHVDTLCPEYRTHRVWLRQHGPALANWPSSTGVS